MSRMLTMLGLSAALAAGATLAAQSTADEPYKLGRFEREGRTFLGLVLRDSVVADLAAANTALEPAAGGARPTIPADMTGLIGRYTELRPRLRAIATAAAASPRPAWAHDLKGLKTLPPVRPQVILNAAVNYTEHAEEMAGRQGVTPTLPAKVPESIPGLWERKADDPRHNPYLFMKPLSAVIGEGAAIRLPPGRAQVDWECELSVVIGRTARRVPADRAGDYIFGYTLQNDVSDRGGRPDGRHGSDWLIGKGHDTFAPIGPFVVPKEFVPDPQKLAIKFTLSGKIMQDSNTDRMTHNVYEVTSFASNIVTLQPGDIVATGSPAGVGTARDTPIYMKAGDVSVCSIERIGTLTNPVVGPEAAPSAAVR